MNGANPLEGPPVLELPLSRNELSILRGAVRAVLELSKLSPRYREQMGPLYDGVPELAARLDAEWERVA